MRVALFALSLFTFAVAAGGPGDQKQELNRLQGTWRLVSVEVDGQTLPPEKSPKEIVIAGMKLSGVGPEMTITINAAKKPKWIDLAFKKGEKDYPIRAIYELNGDDFKLCFPLAPVGKTFENERPESFETKGKGVVLFKAKRSAN